MDRLKKDLAPRQYMLGISIVLMALNIVRILKVPITHDEGFTIIEYVLHPVKDIVTMAYPSANNHILNTLLTKLFFSIFGNGIFFARFASLLSFAIYLYFLAGICKRLFPDNKLIQVATFLLLNLDPFIFEFWGLCRGYSLSLAGMSASVYHLLCYTRTKKTRSLILCLFAIVAAAYSNLALLNVYIAVIVAAMLIQFKDHFRPAPRTLAIASGLVTASAVILYELLSGPISKLKEAQQLYYGGNEGVITDTIQSLVSSTLYKGEYYDSPVTRTLAYLLAAILMIMAIQTIWILFKKMRGPAFNAEQFILNLLLLIPFASLIAQHYLFGTLYVINRTAMFFIPLFLLASVHYIYSLSRFSRLIVASLLTLATINFVTQLNFNRTLLWPYDLYEKAAMERMSTEQPGKKISLRPHWNYAPAFQYYAFAYYPGKFEDIQHTKDDIDTNSRYDYYFVNERHLSLLSPVYVVDTVFEEEYYLMRKVK